MGGKSDDETSSTQMVMPWPGAQPHLTNIYGQAQELNEAGSPGYYPGQTFAPRDPLSDQAQNLRMNYAMNSMPGQIYDSQRAHSFALNSPDAANNPYVQNMMGANAHMLNRNLSENLLPRIAGGAAAAGQKGGSREGIAQGLALRGTQEAIGTSNAQTMMDAYGKGLGAQGLAMGMSPQMMQMGMAPMDVMSQTGQYNTGIDSQALEHDMNRWNYNQNLPWENLNRYNSIIAGAPWGSTTTQEGGGSSPLAGALGGGMLGASAFGPISSSLLAAGPPTAATSALLGLGPVGFGVGGAILGGLLS